MPVLPQYATGAFQEGVGNIEGLMALGERADRRKLIAEEANFRQWERMVRKPVVEAEAKAKVAGYAADIASQKFKAEQTELASRDIVEAQKEFAAMMADPLNTPMERLFNWKQNFSSYAELPGQHQEKFRNMAAEIEHQAQTKRGRAEAETTYNITRHRKETEELEHAEKLAKFNESAMKRAGGPAAEFGVPFKLRGTEQWVMWDEAGGMQKLDAPRGSTRTESFTGGPEISDDGRFERSSVFDEWTAIKAPDAEKISPLLQMDIDSARANVASLLEEVAIAEAEALAAPAATPGAWNFSTTNTQTLARKQAELAGAKLRLQALTGGAESALDPPPPPPPAISDGTQPSPDGSPAGTPGASATVPGSAQAETPAGAGRAGAGKRAGIGGLIGAAFAGPLGAAVGALTGAATAPNQPAPAPAGPTVPAAPPPGSITPEQARALPPGTRYLGQDGEYRYR